MGAVRRRRRRNESYRPKIEIAFFESRHYIDPFSFILAQENPNGIIWLMLFFPNLGNCSCRHIGILGSTLKNERAKMKNFIFDYEMLGLFNTLPNYL